MTGGSSSTPSADKVCLSDPTASVKRKAENIASVEEAEDDLSGTQFVCETVIRSLTLDAAPDHKPPCRQKSPHSECPWVPPHSRVVLELWLPDQSRKKCSCSLRVEVR